jgi:hypothetical protein
MFQTEAEMLCDFDMSTVQTGNYEVEFWLVDDDGATSNHMMADFLTTVPNSLLPAAKARNLHRPTAITRAVVWRGVTGASFRLGKQHRFRI